MLRRSRSLRTKPPSGTKRTKWLAVRRESYERAQGHCDLCGQPLRANEFECHHRKARSQGGRDELPNLVALHSLCHEWVHDHPSQSITGGFICPSWASPLAWPVRVHGVCYMDPGETVWVPTDPTFEQLVRSTDEPRHGDGK